MKHWQETAAILERLSSLPGDTRAALATVVRISGSAYRRPGAKLLVEGEGGTHGGISGGCLETDVRAQALETMRGAGGRILHYDTGSGEETVWGMGLGCEGAVDLWVQPVDARWRAGGLTAMRAHIDAGVPFAPLTIVGGPLASASAVYARGELHGTSGDAALDEELVRRAGRILESGEGDAGSALVEAGAHTVFVDALRPPPRLIVFGAGDDARPLATLSVQAGFDVTVVDHRPAFLTTDRFPPPIRHLSRRPKDGLPPHAASRRLFAVVQTHALANDRGWVQLLATQPLAYLGILGPRVRREQIVRDLALDPERLYAPVGLDVGADGPEQVAISIVAEMLAVLRHRQPGHLRARAGGIHEE